MVVTISVVSGVLWRFPVFRVCVAVGGLVLGQWLLLLFDACAITCGHSFTVLGVWVDLISFRSVLVFFPALLSLLFLLPYCCYCYCYYYY